MEDNVPQPPAIPPKSSTKHHLWRLGAYLTPFVYAALLIIWPHSLPAWLVILAGIFVLSLFVIAALLHIRDIGGWKHLEAYVHDHLWSSMAAIAVFCCIIFGTGGYLYSRPPHVKTEAHNVPPAPEPSQIAPQPMAPPKVTVSPKVMLPRALPKKSKPNSIASAPTAQQPRESPTPQLQPTVGCIGGTGNACAGVNQGTMIGTMGYVPPPHRIMSQPNMIAAIALLKTAAKGSRVYLSVIGERDQEMIDFTNQVGRLFQESPESWEVVLPVNTIWQTPDAEDQGRGLGCSIDNAISGAGEIAERALALAGFPCAHGAAGGGPDPVRIEAPPFVVPQKPIDILISIGTRISPPR